MKKVWLIVAGVSIVGVLVFVIVMRKPSANFLSSQHDQSLESSSSFSIFESDKPKNLYAEQMGADRDCQGEGPIEFSRPPMDLTDVATILPYGLLAGGHVTPIDHMYFSPKDFQSAPDTYPVYAIADGTIATISFRAVNVADSKRHNTTKKGDFRMDVYYNCTFFSYYDLITSLAPELAEKVPTDTSQSWYERVSIPIKAGQLIGRIGGQTLDWAVYNGQKQLSGFVVPEHYDREPWKIYTDYQSLDYFVEPFKTQLYAMLARQVEPRIGKIDHDIDGKLVGNWFLEGTNGYAGNKTNMQYWDGHLAVVPDYIDPTFWHFSTGDWQGEAKQFGLKDPLDPTKIDKQSGVIKYELYQSELYDADTDQTWSSYVGTIQNPKGRVVGTLQGVVLLQLTSDRQLKVETFPGKTAGEVSGFTEKAKIYER